MASLIRLGVEFEVNGDLMAGGALELGTEFVQRPGHGAAGQHFEFGSVKVGTRRHEKYQSEY